MEHLFNCHNEWAAVFAAIGGLPFIGLLLKAKLCKLKDHFQDKFHNHSHEPHEH